MMADKKDKTVQDPSTYKRIHKEEVKHEKQPLFTRNRVLALLVIVCVICGIFFFTTNSKSDKYTSKVSTGSTKIVTGDVTVTKQGFYEYLLKQSGSNKTIEKAYALIADELITDKKAIDKKVKELEDTYKSYMGSVKAYATAMGYDSVDDFEKNQVIPSAKESLLATKYLKDNYAQACKDYQVAYLMQVSYEKESDALKAIKKYTTKKEFKKIKNVSDLGCVTKNTSTLDKNITSMLSTLSTTTKDGVYSKAVRLSTGEYAVLFIYNTDKKKNKDTITDSLASDTNVQDDIKAYYLKKYNFTVYDKQLKKEIEKSHSTYLK